MVCLHAWTPILGFRRCPTRHALWQWKSIPRASSTKRLCSQHLSRSSMSRRKFCKSQSPSYLFYIMCIFLLLISRSATKSTWWDEVSIKYQVSKLVNGLSCPEDEFYDVQRSNSWKMLGKTGDIWGCLEGNLLKSICRHIQPENRYQRFLGVAGMWQKDQGRRDHCAGAWTA